MNNLLRAVATVVIAVLLASPNASFAVDWTEDGGTDNWSDNNNWSSSVPGPSATAVFNPNDGPRTQFVDFDQTASVANLYVQAGNAPGGFSYLDVLTTIDGRANTRLDITDTLRLQAASSAVDTGRVSLTLKQMNVFAANIEATTVGPEGVGDKLLRLVDTQLITNMDANRTGSKFEIIVEEDSLLANVGTGRLNLSSDSRLELATGGVIDWELSTSSSSQIVIGEGSGRVKRSRSINSDVTLTDASSRMIFGDPSEDGASSFTFVEGTIAGPGGVVVDGPNQSVHLLAANTFTGGLRLEQGVASASSGSRLGGLSSFLQFSGGTLRTTGSFTIGIDSFISGVGGIDTAGNDVSVAGDFTGTVSGVFVKSGGGTLTLNNNGSDYSGNFLVEGGTLVSGNGDTFGNRSSVEVRRFATLRFDSAENFDGLNGDGSVDLNGQNVRLGTNDTQTNDFAGQLFGGGSILMSGTGTQRFSGDNSGFTGTIGFADGADGVLVFAQVESLGRDIDVPSGNVVEFALETGESDYIHALSGSGLVFKSGAGTLDLTGDSTNFDGGIYVGGGAVKLGETVTLREAAVSDGGALSGGGTIGLVEVFADSSVSPGRDVGKLTVSRYLMKPDAVLAIELADDNGVAGVDYDQLVVTDNARIDDATLSVSLVDGFVPAHGAEFQILDIEGALTGTGFTQLNLPEVPGMAWDTSRVLPEGLIAIEVVLPGDYNLDGTVDAADYTVWRSNEGAAAGALASDIDGGVIGEAQYKTWIANYGRSMPAMVANFGRSLSATATIPEPTSAVLLIFAVGFGEPRLRRSR